MTPDATKLSIDLGALAANWRIVRDRAGTTAAAVVKADAYGLGAARVAPALHDAGCRHFFVAHLSEALAIRPLLPGAMVAVLNGMWPGTEAEYLAHDIRPVLGSLEEIETWRGLAHEAGRALPALVHIDTGMNRLGLSAADVDRLAGAPALLDGIAIDYLLTHFISAERHGDPVTEQQFQRFTAACARLPPARRSMPNSAGSFLGPRYATDLVRPGAALYGINPTPDQANPMQVVVRLRAKILQIREVGPGTSVGYNQQWTAARDSRIAVCSVGYADGFLRSQTNRAIASFDGKPVPLVGRVSMDLTTFDVTDVPQARRGDWLELLGPDALLDDAAARAGTNAYELLTDLGRRYTRTYRPA